MSSRTTTTTYLIREIRKRDSGISRFEIRVSTGQPWEKSPSLTPENPSHALPFQVRSHNSTYPEWHFAIRGRIPVKEKVEILIRNLTPLLDGKLVYESQEE